MAISGIMFRQKYNLGKAKHPKEVYSIDKQDGFSQV